MLCRKIIAIILMFTTFCCSGVFATINLPANVPSEYQKYLNTPQGQAALKQYQDGQKTEAGMPPDAAQSASVNETAQNPGEQTVGAEKTFYSFVTTEGFSRVELFGYKVFQQTAGSFVPSTDTPVPAGYIIGSGDSFTVTLWGMSEGIFEVSVDAEGNIVLPKVGVVSVAGLRYSDLKSYIQQQLGRYYESISVNIGMSQIKSIRIYIVGDVAKPGSYAVSSLSTLYGALFQAGGPSKQGTLRNIKLIRGNQTIATVDLYKFLLYGDKSQDRELLSGDTIFVPPIGDLIAIVGNVKRPAVYEIKGSADLTDILKLSGGFTPDSSLNRIQLERVIAHERRVVMDRNVSTYTERANIVVQNMDLIKVYPIYGAVQNIVFLEGQFKQTGAYEWLPGMKLKDLIPSEKVLLPTAYLSNAELIRLDPRTLKADVIDVNLERLFAGDEKQNIEIFPSDKIVVQTDQYPEMTVTLNGEFKLPGTYVIRDGERLSSVIERAGGFTEDAYLFGSIFIRMSALRDQTSGSNRFLFEFNRRIAEEEYKLATTSLSSEKNAQNQASLERSRALLTQLGSFLIKGRVVIELADLDEFTGSKSDFVCENGDTLSVPSRSNLVSVLGEVYSPSSFLWEDDKSVSYYISKVGGKTAMGDTDNLIIIRADGSVLSKNNAWKARLESGDVVVVPPAINVTYFDWINFTSTWVGWFYQLALSFAVIATYVKQ
ncbi:MAG: SLBB domain-containing protein [Candidatus Margulisiibacteriota bacterium]